MVIGLRGTGARATMTVRKVSFGQGVERIFPLHAQTIEKIEVVKQARVRRAKLYYLRERKGKAGRMKEKRAVQRLIRRRGPPGSAAGAPSAADGKPLVHRGQELALHLAVRAGGPGAGARARWRGRTRWAGAPCAAPWWRRR